MFYLGVVDDQTLKPGNNNNLNVRHSSQSRSPVMSRVREEEIYVDNKEDSVGYTDQYIDDVISHRKNSDSQYGSTESLERPREIRPRILTFPNEQKHRAITRNHSRGATTWTNDKWTRINGDGTPIVNRRLSLAEKEFLASPEHTTYNRLRSFSFRKGKLVDTGYCYQSPSPHEDPLLRRRDALKQALESDRRAMAYHRKSQRGRDTLLMECNQSTKSVKSNRRATCPDIWLTRADTLTATLFDCNVWIIGPESTGKSTLMTALHQAAQDEYKVIDNPNISSDCLSISCLVDGDEFAFHFRKVTLAQLQVQREAQRSDVYMVLYNVASRSSFSAAGDVLYTLMQDTQRIKPALLPVTILVGNKADLQRRRLVSEREGRTLSKVYDCAFHEVSAALNLKVDSLLEMLLVKVRKQHMRQLRSNSPSSDRSSPESPGRRISLFIRDHGRRIFKSAETLICTN